jgi:glutaredoxin 3
MSNQVIIWSKDNCTYCDQSKQLLQSRNIGYEERKIGYEWTLEDFQKAVPNARSLPQIFIDGDHIGGFTQLKEMLP